MILDRWRFLMFLFSGLLFSFHVHAQDNREATEKRFEATGLQIGSKLPDTLEVYRANGDKMMLADLFRIKPTVIISGCLTCPIFLRTYPEIEAIYRDYEDKVNFYFLYKTLAHPENHGYVQPFIIEERLTHIAHATKKLQTTIPWLADPISNEVSTTFGISANSEFLFNENGEIFYMNAWSDARELREALINIAGPTTGPITTPESLNLPKVHFNKTRSKGELTTRVSVSEELIPIATSIKDTIPYYVKLRAEVTNNLLENGWGKLYLGFHLDPIYGVHWNNLVDPLSYEVINAAGIKSKHLKGVASKVNRITDREPREFFIEVSNWKAEQAIILRTNYYACDTNDKKCEFITQNYELVLREDLYAGGVYGRSFMAGSNDGSNEHENKINRLLGLDKNKDGLVEKSEVPERMLMRFKTLDLNGDGILNKEEIENIRKQ